MDHAGQRGQVLGKGVEGFWELKSRPHGQQQRTGSFEQIRLFTIPSSLGFKNAAPWLND